MASTIHPQTNYGEIIYGMMRHLSLITLYAAILIAVLAVTEGCAWMGRRAAANGDRGGDTATLATGSLGLLALLIAFTFSMAVSRYDARRQVVLAEANAIGSTANFALMLPVDQQKPILDLLRRYTVLRVNLGIPYEPGKLERDSADSVALQGALWRQAIAVTAAAPQSLPAYRFVASLNEVNNIGEQRVTALRNHVPVTVTLVLIGTALVAMGFTGYSLGVAMARRPIAKAVLALTIALLVIMTMDLQRPERGMIDVPRQALIDTLNALPP